MTRQAGSGPVPPRCYHLDRLCRHRRRRPSAAAGSNLVGELADQLTKLEPYFESPQDPRRGHVAADVHAALTLLGRARDAWPAP